jgi:hypothetical protein
LIRSQAPKKIFVQMNTEIWYMVVVDHNIKKKLRMKKMHKKTKSAFYDFLDTSSVLNKEVNKNCKHENKNILKGKMAQWNELLYEVALNFSTIYIF